MGGGNGIVDGFRRLFHRRTPSGSVLGSSNQSSAGEDSSDVEVVEDLDLVGLRPIRVPKRKMPLPVESHKKVSTLLDGTTLCWLFSMLPFWLGGRSF